MSWCDYVVVSSVVCRSRQRKMGILGPCRIIHARERRGSPNVVNKTREKEKNNTGKMKNIHIYRSGLGRVRAGEAVSRAWSQLILLLTMHHPSARYGRPPPLPPHHELLFLSAVLLFCWNLSTSGHTVRKNRRRSTCFAPSALGFFITTSPAAENSRSN